MWASGPSAPATADGWQLLTSTTKVTVTATFPSSLPAGTTIWLAAFWTNAKGHSGPACIPVSANLPGGASQVVMGELSPMKIAA